MWPFIIRKPKHIEVTQNSIRVVHEDAPIAKPHFKKTNEYGFANLYVWKCVNVGSIEDRKKQWDMRVKMAKANDQIRKEFFKGLSDSEANLLMGATRYAVVRKNHDGSWSIISITPQHQHAAFELERYMNETRSR